MKIEYNQQPQTIIKGTNREIASFSTNVADRNIDDSVVESFGNEWQKFHQFSEKELDKTGKEYFDIIDEKIVNKDFYCLDAGCGTGRWSKYLCGKAGFIEAIDPSDAILVADRVLQGAENVRLSKASIDNIPFPDETFDFGMSVGVLHHIPDTGKALSDCVKKVKRDGHFYVYLYYALDNRGWSFRVVFFFVNVLRKIISAFPSGIKKFLCDMVAVFIYMPVILLGRFFRWIGLKRLATSMPLNTYHKRTFFMIRNDALDRFGTKLEQRFSRKQIVAMMQKAGLDEIVVSENFPYWHAIGKRVNNA